LALAPYDDLAQRWEGATGAVYRPLAGALVAAAPMTLAGCRAVDIGSGTGVVAQAATASGATVVPVDRSLEMIEQGFAARAVAGDVLALPFGAGEFDVALAGFLLNHLPPVPALAEMARVTRMGGAVLASTWVGGQQDPVKKSIDAVLAAFGWVWPEWYAEMKAHVEPISGDPVRCAQAARQAGLTDVRTSIHREDFGLMDPRAVVAFRLAMPHIAPWIQTLDQRTGSALIDEATISVTQCAETWRPAVILLVGRVGSQSF
jgi:ubiquinone/menaquinone biosynthesis C-methylase UbiE